MKDFHTIENDGRNIYIYTRIENYPNPKIFLINDGDIFIKMKDEILSNLDKSLDRIVLVFISSNNRFHDYVPWSEKDFRESYPFSPGGDDYIDYLHTELLALLENYLDISLEPSNIFIAGASLGGLISLYGLLEYPDYFAGAICISSSLWYDGFLEYMEEVKNINPQHRIYLDVGDREGRGKITLYRDILDLSKKAYNILLSKGYKREQILFKIQKNMSHRSDFFVDRLCAGIDFMVNKK